MRNENLKYPLVGNEAVCIFLKFNGTSASQKKSSLPLMRKHVGVSVLPKMYSFMSYHKNEFLHLQFT